MASEHSKLDKIVASFSTLEDPRSHINRHYPLLSVLDFAVLAGAADATSIARWAKCKEELLTGFLELPCGISAKDVFRRLLMILRPEAFNAWIARLRDRTMVEMGVNRPIMTIDGKSSRRSHDVGHALGVLHVVTD